MTYFSRQGAPLRAEVSLSMEVVNLAEYAEQLENDRIEKEKAKQKAEEEQVERETKVGTT